MFKIVQQQQIRQQSIEAVDRSLELQQAILQASHRVQKETIVN